MGSKLIKTISFYRLSVIDKGVCKRAPHARWKDALGNWAQGDFKDRFIKEVYYSPELGASLPALGIHAPVKSDFKTTVDSEQEEVKDAAEVLDSLPWKLSESSVIIFVPGTDIIGIAKATKTSPSVQALIPFLSIAVPLEDGAYWQAKAIMAIDQFEKLTESKRGVSQLYYKTETKAELPLYDDPASDDLAVLIDDLTKKVSSELEIEISIKIPQKHRSNRTLGNFRNYTMNQVKTLLNGKAGKITVCDESGFEEEIINLFEHHLSESFTIDELSSDEATFINLLHNAARTVEENLDKLHAHMNSI